MSDPLSIFDRPNSYIGRSVPRPDAKRLLEGRGQFVDDLQLPRMVHAAFLRSPYAHARIRSIDIAEAEALPGVVAVLTGEDFVSHVTPSSSSSGSASQSGNGAGGMDPPRNR